MASTKLKKLNDQEKADIWSKCDSEGLAYYLQNYAPSDFKDTEHDEKLKQLLKLLNYFDGVIGHFEEISINQYESET